MLAITR